MDDETPPSPPVKLDLKGLKCPLPALHTSRALERAAPGTRFEVASTDPMSVIDIPHMVRQTGNVLEGQETPENGAPEAGFLFRIRKAD